MGNSPKARNAAFAALRTYTTELDGVEPENYTTVYSIAGALTGNDPQAAEAMAPIGLAAQTAATDLLTDLMHVFGEDFIASAYEDAQRHFAEDVEEGEDAG